MTINAKSKKVMITSMTALSLLGTGSVLSTVVTMQAPATVARAATTAKVTKPAKLEYYLLSENGSYKKYSQNIIMSASEGQKVLATSPEFKGYIPSLKTVYFTLKNGKFVQDDRLTFQKAPGNPDASKVTTLAKGNVASKAKTKTTKMTTTKPKKSTKKAVKKAKLTKKGKSGTTALGASAKANGHFKRGNQGTTANAGATATGTTRKGNTGYRNRDNKGVTPMTKAQRKNNNDPQTGVKAHSFMLFGAIAMAFAALAGYVTRQYNRVDK